MFSGYLSPGWAFKFAVLRLAAHWRSLLTLIVGVLLAAVIGANVPLYTAAVSQVGMVERIEQQPLEDVQIYNRITYQPAEGEDLAATRQNFDRDLQARLDNTIRSGELAGWVEQIITGIESLPLQVANGDQAALNGRFRIAYYDDWQNQVEVVEGA